MQKKIQTPIKILIDVSGTPFGQVYIGLVSLNVYQTNDLMKEFKQKFPNFSKPKIKSSQLKNTDVNSVIDFLNFRKIRMGAINIGVQDWVTYRKKYGNSKSFKEKIFAIHYFTLLRQFTFPTTKDGRKYEVIVCKENFLDIEQVLKYCKILGNVYNRDFDFSISLSKFTELLKLPDFVAGAYRKVDEKTLRKYQNLLIIKKKPETLYFLKLFKN